MNNKKVIFMGTPDIACAMLQQLIDDGYDVIRVVSQPDKKVGRKQIVQETPVKQLALANNIEVFQPISIKEDYRCLIDLNADLIVTCAYGQFIPEELLNAPVYGSVNVHASLLPKLRGGAPIHKAIINGDKETGISLMRMVKKMDAGAVMAQAKVAIEENDVMGDVYEKLKVCGAKILHEQLPVLFSGNAHFEEQNEEEATFAWNISKEEEKIDFSKSMNEVYNHIRGLIPWPVGYAILNGKKIKFHKVRKLEKNHNYSAGELVGMMEQGFAVAANGGFILLDELQLEGKGKVDAKSFYNGNGKNLIGTILE